MSTRRKVLFGAVLVAAVIAAAVAIRNHHRADAIERLKEFTRNSDYCLCWKRAAGSPTLEFCVAPRDESIQSPSWLPPLHLQCTLPSGSGMSPRAALAYALTQQPQQTETRHAGDGTQQPCVVGIVSGKVHSFDTFEIESVEASGDTDRYRVKYTFWSTLADRPTRPGVAFFKAAVRPGLKRIIVEFQQFHWLLISSEPISSDRVADFSLEIQNGD